MKKYILKRILQLIPTLFGVALITFILFNVVGGSPALLVLGKNATAEAIADLNGEKLPTIPNVAINLPFINTSPTNHTDSDGATLPYDYISDDYQRINFYRRIAECYSDEQLEQIKQDTIDRFGKLPKPVSRLFAITALKLLAGKYGIDSISYINGELHIYCKGIVYRTANDKLPRPSVKNPDALLTSIKNLVKCAGKAIGKP